MPSLPLPLLNKGQLFGTIYYYPHCSGEQFSKYDQDRPRIVRKENFDFEDLPKWKGMGQTIQQVNRADSEHLKKKLGNTALHPLMYCNRHPTGRLTPFPIPLGSHNQGISGRSSLVQLKSLHFNRSHIYDAMHNIPLGIMPLLLKLWRGGLPPSDANPDGNLADNDNPWDDYDEHDEYIMSVDTSAQGRLAIRRRSQGSKRRGRHGSGRMR